MEIIIGSIPSLGPQNVKPQEKPTGMIEAQILHIRPPRKGIAGPSGMERRGKKVSDPHQARILTIMVPDVSMLPPDLEQGKYTVYMRFVRK
jgi:hypothetical protein